MAGCRPKLPSLARPTRAEGAYWKPAAILALAASSCEASPFNIATEGSEAVGVNSQGQADSEAEALLQDRRNDLLFAMHGRQHSDFFPIGKVAFGSHQK
jgi:hypothetical protein